MRPRIAVIAVIGVDGIEEALSAIRRGAMSATVAQYPYTIGQLGVQACLAAARGKRIPARIDAPIQVVKLDNVARAQANFPEPLDAFSNPLRRAAAELRRRPRPAVVRRRPPNRGR